MFYSAVKRVLPLLLLFILALDIHAARVISLSPAVTEIICQLGGFSQLAGRSRVCNYPQEVQTLPVAGDLGMPEIETILKLKPDYVLSDIAAPHPGWELLQKLGIKVEIFSAANLQDYEKTVRRLGEILDCPEAAQNEIDRFYRALATQPSLPRKGNVLILLGLLPPVSCSGNTFIHHVISQAGAVNIFETARTDYFQVSPELLSGKKVDFVIISGIPGFNGELPEVLAEVLGSAKIITAEPADLYLRLGPRLPEGIRMLYLQLKEKSN